MITYHLKPHLTSLWPPQHVTEIDQLLTDYHKLHMWTLTYSPPEGSNDKPDMVRGENIRDTILEKLDDPNTSESYRKALEFKLKQ